MGLDQVSLASRVRCLKLTSKAIGIMSSSWIVMGKVFLETLAEIRAG